MEIGVRLSRELAEELFEGLLVNCPKMMLANRACSIHGDMPACTMTNDAVGVCISIMGGAADMTARRERK